VVHACGEDAGVTVRRTLSCPVKCGARGSQGIVLVDNRPQDQYVGINRNPKVSQSGTLPGARNLPSGWITENAKGTFRPKSQIEKLYKVANVPTSGEQINFCNTGHLGSIGWFVSSEILGNKQAKLYDGSMVEWTLAKAGPVEQKVKLDDRVFRNHVTPSRRGFVSALRAPVPSSRAARGISPLRSVEIPRPRLGMTGGAECTRWTVGRVTKIRKSQ
jgi:hypothetical protein